MASKSINIGFLFLFKWAFYCFLLFASSFTVVSAETIRIAVASNFLKPAQKLAILFEQQTTHQVKISSGSSGKLYLQITKGAPFDLLLSADKEKPRELIKNGYALESSLTTYALGRLSLWIKNCPDDPKFEYLQNNNLKKIALANPKLAPYGFSSEQFLLEIGIWDKIKNKIIYLENISQVTQVAQIGVVDAALIATSHQNKLMENKQSCVVNIPEQSYPKIEQQLVIMLKSNKKTVAKEFINLLLSIKGQNLIKNMGYSVTASDKIHE